LKDSRGRKITEGKGKEEGEEGEVRKNSVYKKAIGLVFWNVAGEKSKDRDFWDYLEKFDVIGLCETCIEEREGESLKLRLSKRFVWKCQYAVRAKKKRRAKERIITEVRKGIEEINVEETKAIDGIQERRLRLEGRLWRIISVYNNSSMKNKRREIEEMLGDLEEEILCIGGGDFYTRIGKEGKRIEGEEDEEPWRNSKDEEINNEGRELLGLVEDREWDIANGNMRGDENGELTYIGGREESVVEYILVN